MPLLKAKWLVFGQCENSLKLHDRSTGDGPTSRPVRTELSFPSEPPGAPLNGDVPYLFNQSPDDTHAGCSQLINITNKLAATLLGPHLGPFPEKERSHTVGRELAV